MSPHHHCHYWFIPCKPASSGFSTGPLDPRFELTSKVWVSSCDVFQLLSLPSLSVHFGNYDFLNLEEKLRRTLAWRPFNKTHSSPHMIQAKNNIVEPSKWGLPTIMLRMMAIKKPSIHNHNLQVTVGNKFCPGEDENYSQTTSAHSLDNPSKSPIVRSIFKEKCRILHRQSRSLSLFKFLAAHVSLVVLRMAFVEDFFEMRKIVDIKLRIKAWKKVLWNSMG